MVLAITVLVGWFVVQCTLRHIYGLMI